MKQPCSLLWLVAVALLLGCPSSEPTGGGAPPAPGEAGSPGTGGQASYDPALARQLTVEAIEACRGERFTECRDTLRRAASHRPGQVEIWMLLAGVEHRLGHGAEAEAALDRVVALGQRPPFERAPFYDTLKETELHRLKLEELDALIGERRVAQPLFTLEDVDLVPEGVAHDATTGTWYVSSVHRRGIVRWQNGETDWLVAEGELWSVLGIAVDPARRVLWATTAALPQMQGYEDDLEGRSALVEIDLGSGAERRRFELGRDRRHVLNDLALAADGTVYVTDNRLPGGVHRLGEGDPELASLVPEGTLRSPQGVALSADEKRLYVADYSFGLVLLDPAAGAGEVSHLRPPENVGLTGIDGLASVPSAGAEGLDVLIAIQNLYPPHRVLRLEVDPEALEIRRAQVLEQARTDYSEPTLGAVVDGAFVYVANSQWNRFDEAARLPEKDQLARPLLLRLPL